MRLERKHRPNGACPNRIDERFADRVFVHSHGGAWVFGGGDSALREAVWLAHGLGVKVVSVDYRRPPLHPFPAAIDDTVAVWQAVIENQGAAKTALFGTSAGGNIALATTLKLKKLGQPLPGSVFAGTPATDLANISDTWHTLEGLDPLGGRKGMIAGAFDLYIGKEDPANPLLSPVNGDLAGFPPTILIRVPGTCCLAIRFGCIARCGRPEWKRTFTFMTDQHI